MNLNDTCAAWQPRVLSILRIMTGLLLFAHGTAKILGFPAVQMFANLQLSSMFGIAGFIELIFGALLAIGLFSRFSAFILSGLAACAYFIVYAGKSFFPIVNGGESAVVYCFLLFYLAFAGGGVWSLDAIRKQNG